MSFVGFLVKAEREFSESEEIAEALCFFALITQQLCNEKPEEEKEESEK